MWKNHGLQQLPKIIFRETKQIIPDKNLFGTSNFAASAFDVLIQLGNRSRSKSARLPSQSPYQSPPQSPRPPPTRVINNPCTPKSDSENNGRANDNSNVMVNKFTNGAMDKVNINHLITDVGSASNGGDDINMFADVDAAFDSDSDHDYPRETNHRGTYGESDLERGYDFNSRTSVISLNDIFEDEDGNEHKIAQHKISVNSRDSRRKTNVLREGQNEGNDSDDSDVNL